MSVGSSPDLYNILNTILQDAAPHSMSELYNISFTDGSSSVSSGTISLSSFINKIISTSTPTYTYSSGFEWGYYNDNYHYGGYSGNQTWFDTRTPVYTHNSPGRSRVTNFTNISTASSGQTPVNGDETYSYLWTGYFKAPITSTYYFNTRSDDNSHMWVGTSALNPSYSNETVDNGGLHGMQTVTSAGVSLTGGVYYDFRMTFGEQGGGDDLQAQWRNNSTSFSYDWSTVAFSNRQVSGVSTPDLLRSKGLTGTQGYTMYTNVPSKDMTTVASTRTIPSGYNPSSGALSPSGNRYYWNDWSGDWFDGWGDFYIYDPSTISASYISFASINGGDGTVYTETQTHHGKSFTIKHGWVTQGIFKLDVECSDDTFNFSIGMYGNMGSDGSTQNTDRQYSASWGTLSYNYNSQGNTAEYFYSHCIPKLKTFNDGITLSGSNFTSNFKTSVYGNDNLAIWTDTLTWGSTFYFVKGSNSSSGAMYNWVENDIEFVQGSSGGGSSNVAQDITISTNVTSIYSSKITSFSSTSVDVSSVSGIAQGDWVMIHQTYYPLGNSNLSSVCPYEFKEISSVSGSTLTFTTPISGTFIDGAQVIKAYRCNDFTLNSGISITTNAWDVSTYTGGIIPIYADGTVTINGTINMEGKGYQGREKTKSGNTFEDGQNGRGIDNSDRGAGIGGLRGAGGYGNAGGGGGGGHENAGSIGNGSGLNSGNVSGGSAFGSTSGNYLTMGGSGGQGAPHDINGAYQRGGHGGGAVFIQGTDITGSGTINVNGTSGHDNVNVRNWQGGAGGGAGGMVLFKTISGTASFTNVTKNGGSGLSGTNGSSVAQTGYNGGDGSTGRFVNISSTSSTINIAFHYGTFSSSDYSGLYSTVSAATTAGHVYSDSPSGTYTWGTLGTPSLTSTGTTYTWTPSSNITGADVLMVAGGGGTGLDEYGGGGGAGELIFLPSQSISSAQKTVVVGNGGAGVNSNTTNASSGGDTEFLGITANGGGASRTSGGSGGGQGRDQNGSAGASVKTGNGYGNAGGIGLSGGWGGAGGGGGAGTAGGTGGGGTSTSEYGGPGGDGLKEVTISGTLYNFATVFGGAIYGEVISGDSWFAGGGGGAVNSVAVAIGGYGGGGTGGKTNVPATDGKRHTGGGGGGGGVGTSTGPGNGGSGVVLIKY